MAVAVGLNGRDNGGLAGGTAPTLPPWTFATQAGIVHLYVAGRRLAASRSFIVCIRLYFRHHAVL